MHRYIESRDDLNGLRLPCGEHSKRVFANILRLDEIGYKIISMGWIGDKIVLELSQMNKPSEGLILNIGRRVDTQPSLLKTDSLDFYYSGQRGDERFTKHLLSIDLKEWTFDRLIDILKKDPEFGSAKLPLPVAERPDRPRNHLDSWGGDDLYANFFAEGEFARGQLDSVNIYENCVFIQHSDIECVCLKPNIDLRLIRYLVRYPWLSQNTEKYSGIKRDEVPDMNKFYSTDLRERDIIIGHNKLKDALDYAVDNIKDKNIFLSNTCTPVVIGEDVESLVEKARRKNRRILYLTVTPQSMETVLKDLFKRCGSGKSYKNEKQINLVGYEYDYYLTKLISMVNRLGIKVNSVVIPNISDKELRRYRRGGFDIIKPNALWNHLYNQLISASSHKYKAIEAPYGFEGTKNWILQISSLLGIDISEKEIYKNIDSSLLGEYRELKERMKGINVAFVIRKNESSYITDSAKLWGIPVLRFLMEMNSGLRIYIKAKSREEAVNCSEQILKELKDYSNFEIRYFDSFEMMMRILTQSDAQLIFTNHTNDWRVSSCGKNPISLTDFEIGFYGAIHTMRNLLHLADNMFFRKYHRFLKRGIDGRYIEQKG